MSRLSDLYKIMETLRKGLCSGASYAHNTARATLMTITITSKTL